VHSVVFRVQAMLFVYVYIQFSWFHCSNIWWRWQ